MPRQAFVNGQFVAHRDASVHIEDRGYQFADAVYEVVPVMNGQLIDALPHWERLERSLTALDIPMPCSRTTIDLRCRELLRRNRVRNGMVYLQVSRGVAPRDHLYADGMTPSLVLTCKAANFRVDTTKGIGVKTVADNRWGRVDIKTVGLLPNCMAKALAAKEGFEDAWLVDDQGMVTEGTSNNAWIVLNGPGGTKRLVTRNATHAILNGVTRLRILQLAEEQGWQVEQRAFSLDEALSADEAFITSATSFVKPVTRIDDRVLRNAEPGDVTRKIGQVYQAFVEKAAIRA